MFERAAILKHLEVSGTCPVTGEPLSADDLIALRSSKVEKPSALFATVETASLIDELKSRFVSLLTENAKLAEDNARAQAQIAELLYVKDAATRLIAEKLQEIDELKQQSAAAAASDAEGCAPAGAQPAVRGGAALQQRFTALVSETARALLGERKKRRFPDVTPCITTAQLGSCEEPVTAACAFLPQVAADGSLAFNFHLFGTADAKLFLFDSASRRATALPSGEASAVTALAFYGQPPESSAESESEQRFFVVSGHASGAVQIFEFCASALPHESGSWALRAAPTEFATPACVRTERGAVSSLQLHPAGAYCFVAGQDSALALLSLPEHRVIADIAISTCVGRVAAFCVQPDGNMLVVCDAANNISIFDLAAMESRSKFNPPEIDGAISCCAFTERGYVLAVGTNAGLLYVIDMRKQRVVSTQQCEQSVRQLLPAQNAKLLAVAVEDGLLYFVETQKLTFKLQFRRSVPQLLAVDRGLRSNNEVVAYAASGAVEYDYFSGTN